MPHFKRPARIGLSGTGFIAEGLARLLNSQPERYHVTSVLTDRKVEDLPQSLKNARATHDPAELADRSDLVVECSGRVGRAMRTASEVLGREMPLVTMNAEFQVTLGAAFAGSHLITEAQGDQPGSLAALREEAIAMGFRPRVYGSQKGFLCTDPQPDDMAYWAQRQGISIPSTVAFTDGTKVQIEQALVANGLGADIAQEGMIGPSAATLESGGEVLARKAFQLNTSLSDYVLQPGGKGEVFIIAEHPDQPEHLAYYKLGDGPFFMLTRPFHLGHYEVPITIERMLNGGPPLLRSDASPRYSVAAIAKRDLPRGTRVDRAIGSFQFRGIAVSVADRPDHVPIGLLEDCRLGQPVEKGQMMTWSDIEFSDHEAVSLAQSLYSSAPGLLAV